MDNANRHMDGFNPLCGDKLTLYLHIFDSIIEDISFEGEGCAISIASASLMTEALKGKTIDEAEALFQQFHTLLTIEGDCPCEKMGKLEVLSGVKAYPSRVKCATLAWHALHAALNNQTDPVSTE